MRLDVIGIVFSALLFPSSLHLLSWAVLRLVCLMGECCRRKNQRAGTIFHFQPTFRWLLAYWNSFNHLYGPAKSSDEGSGIKEDMPWVPIDNDEDSSNDGATESTESSAACAMNSKCSVLGLVGNCCPTKKGVFLECCNWYPRRIPTTNRKVLVGGHTTTCSWLFAG